MAETHGVWEGYGGPIQRERPHLDRIDPTLDSCCQREEEDLLRKSALNRTLRRFDIIAQRVRQRKNLVSTTVFDGCRCCYDPNSDGGVYRALIELRNNMNNNALGQQTQNLVEDDNEQELSEDKSEVSSKSDDDDEFDYLLDEDLPGQCEELQYLEEQRRTELEYTILQREIAHQHGFGVHRQMHPHRVLKAAIQSPCAVLHLVDPDSIASASLDVFLEDIVAPAHVGTKFLRSGGRSTLLLDHQLASKHLFRLKPDCDLPALVAFRDGVAIAYCPRLEGLLADTNNEGIIIPSAVTEWLDRSGVLVSQVPMLEELCRIRPEEEALLDSMNMSEPTAAEQERYDCGMQGCRKSFPHEHIGEKNTQQDGLVVPETTILGD